MKNFTETVEKNMEKLELYVPVVDRVHGGSHPEFHDVKRIYDGMVAKLESNKDADLNKEFEELRKVTDNYKVPEDVCESYEAVYLMLAELDKSYDQ